MKRIINGINLLVSVAMSAFLMASCSNNAKSAGDFADFTISNVELKSVVFDEGTMFPTNLILLSDSLLVVNEPKMKGGFIHVYDTHNQKTITELGVIGDGPNDFASPRFLTNLDTHNTFCVGDASKIVRYYVDSLDIKDYAGDKILSVPSEMRLYNNVLTINDSIIIYNQTGDHPISVFNILTDKLGFIDYLPKTTWAGGTEFIKNMEVFDNSMTSNGREIAVAYKNWNILSIITTDGNVKKELYLPDWDYNLEKMHFDSSTGNLDIDSDAKKFYTKIMSNKDYVFALGWNATNAQIRNGEATSFVYVIDWDGNIVKKIMFDRPVSNFCINKDSIPYATAMGDDGEIHIFQCYVKEV